MRIKLSIIFILSLLSAKTAFAAMELFVSDNCSHCNKLQQEIAAGELDKKFKIQTYEIYNDEGNRDYYVYKAQQLGYKNAQVPLLIDGVVYKEGTSAILEYLENNEPVKDEVDSEKLNELIKAEVDDSQKNKILGLIAIIFGLTLFGTIIWRARKKLYSN